jgi:hypothetical protein
MPAEVLAPYAPAAIKLLQGVLYADDTSAWNTLLTHQTTLSDYFGRIGLRLIVNEADGFAYLQQPDYETDEGQTIPLPRLTRRDRLSYHVTLMCVLLRERLDQFEASTPDSDRLLLSREDVRELMRPFLRERNNELALQRRIDETINKVAELGFLRRQTVSGDEQWEVRRIIKARIGSEVLAEIKTKLVTHATTES